jgi:hypothetical protein
MTPNQFTPTHAMANSTESSGQLPALEVID